jgi:hypothetical protein
MAQDEEGVEMPLADPLPLSIRFGGGGGLPFGDVANEDPRQGWVGAQGIGLCGRLGVRIPFMDTAYARPEIIHQRYGDHQGTIDVLLFDGQNVFEATADHRMTAEMTAFRVSLEYIPRSGGLDIFLAGGLGLAYIAYERTLTVEGGEPFTQDQGELSGSMALEVGIRLGRFELTGAADFQSPRFEDGTPSWNTGHLYLAYALPIR